MSRPTEAEFAELKRKRDEAVNKAIDEMCAEQGWERGAVHVHASHAGDCYCDCPNGPCQHEFGGWREFEDGSGGETFCQRCGTGSMSHSMRCGP